MYKWFFILTSYLLRYSSFVIKVFIDFPVKRFKAVRRNITYSLIGFGKMHLMTTNASSSSIPNLKRKSTIRLDELD